MSDIPGEIMPHGVVFDMDGTLLDTEGLASRAWPIAARAIGVEFDVSLIGSMVGRNSRDCSVLISDRHGVQFPVDALMTAMRSAFEELMAREGVAVMPGAVELLEWLAAARVPMAVATSTRRERAEVKLGEAGLLRHFHGVTGGDEVARGKPAPDIYRLAAQRLGVEPARCLAVEDSEPGYDAAVAAGMPVVFVPDQAEPSARLLAARPRIFATLADVHRWLASLPRGAWT